MENLDEDPDVTPEDLNIAFIQEDSDLGETDNEMGDDDDEILLNFDFDDNEPNQTAGKRKSHKRRKAYKKKSCKRRKTCKRRKSCKRRNGCKRRTRKH